LILSGKTVYHGSLVVKSDLELESCVTEELPIPKTSPTPFKTYTWQTTDHQPEINQDKPDITVNEPRPVKDSLCEEVDIWVQSPYLYLQAAGSDKTDNSSRGIHLRWDLMRELGEQHIPKGELAVAPYPTNIGFNRPDDYVKIFKATYNERFPITLNLETIPNQVNDWGSERLWTYTGLYNTDIDDTVDVVLGFQDTTNYDAVRALINPLNDPQNFIQQYTGVLEVYIPGNPMFEVCFTVAEPRSDSAAILAEAVSLPDALDENSRLISCRKKIPIYANQEQGERCLLCENIEKVRFQLVQTHLYQIELITYKETIRGYNELWTYLDKFSLTTDDAEAELRLEDTANYVVDKQWEKYNDADPGTGAFKVRTENYMERWSNTAPEPGIKQGVIKYLSLSQTDISASENVVDDEGDMVTQISYLEMLRIISIDYHAARMLGWGHIDGMPASEAIMVKGACIILATSSSAIL